MLYPKSDSVPTHWPCRISALTLHVSPHPHELSKEDPQKSSCPTSRGPAPGLSDISEQGPAPGVHCSPSASRPPPGGACPQRVRPSPRAVRPRRALPSDGCSPSTSWPSPKGHSPPMTSTTTHMFPSAMDPPSLILLCALFTGPRP